MNNDLISTALIAHLENLGRAVPELEEAAKAITTPLFAAPRIVLVGRLKAGKSTLVNALVGSDIAETGALEATNVVTVYQNGAPSRAEAHLLDGSTATVPIRHGHHSELPVPSEQIAFIDRWLPTRSLESFSLIDTPGLATLTEKNQLATSRALIDGFEQTKNASVDADAAVFLFESTPRQDEIDFVRSLGFTPLNTLGVLSRADSFGQGALGYTDPIEDATYYARQLSASLKEFFLTIIPVSGLLAETATTGRVTETEARFLSSLSQTPVSTLISAMDEDSPAALDKAQFSQTLDLFGEYGVFKGRSQAINGAADLSEWIARVSGIEQLHWTLHHSLRRFATIHRAVRVYNELEKLRSTYPQYRPEILSTISQMNMDTRLFDVALLRDLKALIRSRARVELIDFVIRILRGNTGAEKLGLGQYATQPELLDEINKQRSFLEELTYDYLDPAEETTIVTLQRVLGALERVAKNTF